MSRSNTYSAEQNLKTISWISHYALPLSVGVITALTAGWYVGSVQGPANMVRNLALQEAADQVQKRMINVSSQPLSLNGILGAEAMVARMKAGWEQPHLIRKVPTRYGPVTLTLLLKPSASVYGAPRHTTSDERGKDTGDQMCVVVEAKLAGVPALDARVACAPR